MPEVRIENLSKVFTSPSGDSLSVLDSITLTVPHGKFITILGPSGCGKTTLLKIVAGLVPQSSGEVYLSDERVGGPGSHCGYVPQAYTLFPWLTVRKNVEFGLRLAGRTERGRRETSTRLLELVGLSEYADYFPKALSGGMKQRVAIARALAVEPQVLLMDEPFGALDTLTRSLMQETLEEIWEKTRTTVLFVTHDIVEAVFLSDKIYLVSARPACLQAEVEIPFERPRTHELKRESRFLEIQYELASRLREESLRVM